MLQEFNISTLNIWTVFSGTVQRRQKGWVEQLKKNGLVLYGRVLNCDETGRARGFRQQKRAKSKFSWAAKPKGSAIILDLNETAAKHLTRPEVACVIGLEFTTPTFLYPKPSLTPLKRLTFSEFQARATISLLGGVEFERFKWAPPIRRTEMTVWFKKQGMIESKDSFTINWQGFYDDLHDRLLLDAFRRWLHWAFERSPTLPSPNEQEVKIDEFPREDLKRQAAELYPDSDDEGEDGEAGTDGKTKPVPKKLNKDACKALCLFGIIPLTA
ncbi:hypothetical protein DFH09DRAFT_1488906 [Mycena vulgaris]|nr:hypothetical protein DFH09DRAFT_1488906 [Mycena vulgaris]